MQTEERIRRLALDGLLADKAHGDMGVYPKSVQSGLMLMKNVAIIKMVGMML